VRVAFGAFDVPSAANCLPSFMELHRQKFCNNQLEHRTTGERAHTMLNLSSEPGCSAADTTLHQAVMLVPLCTNVFCYSKHNFIALNGNMLRSELGARKCRRTEVYEGVKM
jgi:hypothetical protein